MFTTASLLTLTTLLTTIHAHGQITSPTPRTPGTAMASACGQQVYNNQASDSYGNVQGELQVASTQSDYNAAECDIWLCKGYKYADNTANVQSYTAGQVIPITVDIRAPHTGTANVSIVDTSTNSVISGELAYWSVYASTATTIPANETEFSITMPGDLGGKCGVAGECVIQWWWNAESVDQTYESCIDFTLGGSSSNTTTAASSSAVATSSVTAVVSNLAGNAVATSSSFAPTTMATSTLSAISTPTTPAVSSASASVAAMPSGTTLEDILSWLYQYIQGSATN